MGIRNLEIEYALEERDASRVVRAVKNAITEKGPNVGPNARIKPSPEIVEAFIKEGVLDTPDLGYSKNLNLLHYCLVYGFFEEALTCLKMGTNPMQKTGPGEGGLEDQCEPLIVMLRYIDRYPIVFLKDIPSFLDAARPFGLVLPKKHQESLLGHFCVTMAGWRVAAEEEFFVEILKRLLKMGIMRTPTEGAEAVGTLVSNVPECNRYKAARVLIAAGANIDNGRIVDGKKSMANSAKSKMIQAGGQWLDIVGWADSVREERVLAKVALKKKRNVQIVPSEELAPSKRVTKGSRI